MSHPTISTLTTAIRSRQASAAELTRAALDCAQQLQHLNAFLHLLPDEALARAHRIDDLLARGRDPGPLAGVPVALKDNICFGRTTAASRILENYVSPFTATAAQRLIDAGAIVIGKTNMDEFAMGSSGESSAFGPTRNPWDPQRVPGGSSSGSAAAVAAGIVPAALGSDTGGSIRQPAGLCGLVGLKPTYGRVSRYGLVAFASSLDQIGPLTHTVADAALVLAAISGHDPHDSTSSPHPVDDFTRDLERPVEGLVLGIPKQALTGNNHPAVQRALAQAGQMFEDLGATVLEIDLPTTDHGIAAYYIIALAEASSNLARYDGVRYGRRAEPRPGEGLHELYARSRAEGFGPEVQRRIMLGTHALSSGYYDAYYTTALKVRRIIKRDFDRAFGLVAGGAPACHALLMPSSPTPAFRLGEKASDPLSLYLEDVYTVGASLAGLPAITLPAALADVDGASLPVGLQLVAPARQEHTLLRIASTYEQARGPFPAAPI